MSGHGFYYDERKRCYVRATNVQPAGRPVQRRSGLRHTLLLMALTMFVAVAGYVLFLTLGHAMDAETPNRPGSEAADHLAAGK